MNKFKIAHFVEQGQQVIVIPLDANFGRKSQQDQLENRDALQRCAIAAKLAGTVCLVWQEGRQFNFIAPDHWHPFFRSISYQQILANLNKELTCGS